MDLQTQLQELKTSTQAKLAEMRGEHSKELQELRVPIYPMAWSMWSFCTCRIRLIL